MPKKAPERKPSTPPPAKTGEPSRGFTVAGKRVSWDALFVVVGGGLLTLWLLRHMGGGGASGGVPASAATDLGPLPSSPGMPPSGDGSSTAAVPAAGSGATPGPTTPAAGDWWTALYETQLHREPDAVGAATWAASTQALGQAAAMAGFENAPETLVQNDYAQLLGRSADPTGLQTWTSDIIAGMSNDQVRQYIMQSPEYRSKHPTVNV